MSAEPQSDHCARIDTTGYPGVRRQPWFKDRRYTEVWVRTNVGPPESWTMLGMEGPLASDERQAR